MSLEEFSQYALKILELLTTGILKIDKEKRCQACDCLQKEYKFSKEQVYVLIFHKRIGQNKSQVSFKKEENRLEAEKVNICQLSDSACSEKTIKETAQCIVWNNLNE